MEHIDVAERVRRLRGAYGLTQEQLAARSAGGLLREEVVKVERGMNQVTAYRVRKALARAFDSPIEEFASYLDGDLTLGEFLVRREREAAAQDHRPASI